MSWDYLLSDWKILFFVGLDGLVGEDTLSPFRWIFDIMAYVHVSLFFGLLSFFIAMLMYVSSCYDISTIDYINIQIFSRRDMEFILSFRC